MSKALSPTAVGARSGPPFIITLVGLASFLALAAVTSLSLGAIRVHPAALFSALSGRGSAATLLILRGIRLPRVLLGALVGASLSLSGCLLQAVMRNPLAAPNLVGVSSGAGLAALVAMIVFPGKPGLVMPLSFAGGLGAALLVYLLAWKRGARPSRLILAGVAVSSLLGAAANALVALRPDRLLGATDFMVGALAGRGWRQLGLAASYALPAMGASLLLSGRLNILALGDEAALGLGLRPERNRAVFLALAALLAASAASVAGLLGFVGLVAPHFARLLVGADFRRFAPASALFGAGLLVACDCLARCLFDPLELPVGVVTAIVGAPVFLGLLREKR